MPEEISEIPLGYRKEWHKNILGVPVSKLRPAEDHELTEAEFLAKLRQMREEVRQQAASKDQTGDLGQSIDGQIGQIAAKMLASLGDNLPRARVILTDILKQPKYRDLAVTAQLMLLMLAQVGDQPRSGAAGLEAATESLRPGQGTEQRVIRDQATRTVEVLPNVETESRDQMRRLFALPDQQYPELLSMLEDSGQASLKFKVSQYRQLDETIDRVVPTETLVEVYRYVHNVLQKYYSEGFNGFSEHDIIALIIRESSGNPNAHNAGSGARGLTQIRQNTEKELIKLLERYYPDQSFDADDPEQNVLMCLNYLTLKRREMADFFVARGLEVGTDKLSREDFQSVVLASYNTGACAMMGLIQDYLYPRGKKPRASFSWAEFSNYLLVKKDQRESSKAISIEYPIVPEMQPYTKRSVGSIYIGKPDEALHYPKFIQELSLQLSQIQTSLEKQIPLLEERQPVALRYGPGDDTISNAA